MTSSEPLLTVVLPCFNEIGALPELICRLEKVYEETGIQFLLVDNGSTDGTGLYLASVGSGLRGVFILSVADNLGYGGGILLGAGSCSTRFVGWLHADLQIEPESLVGTLPLLHESSVIKGLRYGRPIVDRVFTFIMGVFESFLFRYWMRDINGQPTIVPTSWLHSLPDPPTDFSFDLFVFVSAKKSGMKIVRRKTLMKRRRFGKSSWNEGMSSRVRFVKRTLSYSTVLRQSMSK
jgi:glycosyltransferase involved in cell wall biosynthesis